MVLSLTLVSLLPMVITTMAVLLTMALMPLVWASLEQPTTAEPTGGWDDLLAELAPKRPCRPVGYTPRRGHSPTVMLTISHLYAHMQTMATMRTLSHPILHNMRC